MTADEETETETRHIAECRACGRFDVSLKDRKIAEQLAENHAERTWCALQDIEWRTLE